MPEPTREMFSDEMVEAMERLHMYPRLIAERAAREAVAAERERIRAAVQGFAVEGGDKDYWEGVEEMRAAVLAIIRGEQP